jgi:hypothetical protein
MHSPVNLAELEATAIASARIAESKTWEAAACHRALASAYLAADEPEEAAKAEAIAEALTVRAEGLADNLAALAPIAEGRRIRDLLAALGERGEPEPEA